MRRSFNSSAFTSGSSYTDTEDADPRVGLVNLADVMLVFACGLMVALVVSNGIELAGSQEAQQVEMTEIDESDFDYMIDEMNNRSGAALTQRGIVYEDPVTGELYMLEEVPDEHNDDTGDSGDVGNE